MTVSGQRPSASAPAVTVLIPAYNAAGFVSESIRSALDQTYRDLEVLVVDDGSVDDTARRVEAFEPPVRLLRVPHGGLAMTRNRGMRAARGRFIVFLDADDLIEPDLVERAVRFHERRPDLAFVFGNLRFFSKDRTSEPFIPAGVYGAEEVVLDDPLRQVLVAGYSIAPSGVCAPRDVLEEAGFFDESLWGAEDFEFFSRLYTRRPVGYIDRPLVRLRRHDGNMTNQAARMIPNLAASLEKVQRNCLIAGRTAMALSARRYGRRNMLRAARGVVGRGDGREARRLLWAHRGLLWGPQWLTLIVISLAPAVVARALARLKTRLVPGPL
jgi:glycosyltransferase involved in cell wall biosynthesis